MTVSFSLFIIIGLVAIMSSIGWLVAERRREAAQRGYENVLQYLRPPETIKEYAEKKRIHPSTVARLAREGKIKAEKVGRQWRISQGEK